MSSPEQQPNVRVFLDASLMLYHGLRPPVGCVRVEHYIAEYLMDDPTVDFRCIVYDAEHAAYRPLTRRELQALGRILYHRYDAPGMLSEETAAESDAPSQARQVVGGRFGQLRSRVARVSRMSAAEFGSMITGYAARRLPITAEQPVAKRITTRLGRRMALAGARGAHRGLTVVARSPSARRLLASFEVPAPSVAPAVLDDTPDLTLPGPGDVLVSIGNLWDYMDYRYLAGLCLHDGVRLVAMIHDVIAIELPFTTPTPPHIYHRHWVEVGHLASYLIANSGHSVRAYQRFIAEPNDLSPPMGYAYLPSFLKAHANDIGEVAIPSLEGRPFVVYCSTLEIRKNHELLLHVWSQLLSELDAERVPMLVLVGAWGWSTETVRLLVERNWHVRTHVHVLNHVSDAELIWLYRHARFTVFPSHAEGFGLGAAESLSFGTPVIISDHPALHEATEGLMPAYDPLDVPGWYAAIRELATDDARLATLRAAAARYRGPDYADFATALCAAARSVAA